MGILSDIIKDSGQTASSTNASQPTPQPETQPNIFQRAWGSLFGKSPSAQTTPQQQDGPLASIIKSSKSTSTPTTGPLTDITKPPTDDTQASTKTGPLASILGDKMPGATKSDQPYFYNKYPSGATIGASDQLDTSGRPLLGYRNPGDTSTTTDKTRVDTTFDPTVAQPLTKDQYYNPRAQDLRDTVGKKLGILPSEQLDHAIALTVGGSNQPENLRRLSTEENQAAGKTEMDLAQQLKDGKISYLDAQVQEAKDKGLPAPWVPPEYRDKSTGVWDHFKNWMNDTFGVPDSQAATTQATSTPSVLTQIMNDHKASVPDTLSNPDDFTKESSRIDAVTKDIQTDSDRLAKLKTSLDSSDQKSVDDYNTQVNQFNTKLDAYQTEVKNYNASLNKYKLDNPITGESIGPETGDTTNQQNMSLEDKARATPVIGGIMNATDAIVNDAVDRITGSLQSKGGTPYQRAGALLHAGADTAFALPSVILGGLHDIPVLAPVVDAVNNVIGGVGQTGSEYLSKLWNKVPDNIISADTKKQALPIISELGSLGAQIAAGDFATGAKGSGELIDRATELKAKLADTMFSGLKETQQLSAWKTLGYPKSATELKANYVKLSSQLHPDKPDGSTQSMTDLNKARDVLQDPKTGEVNIPSKAAMLRSKLADVFNLKEKSLPTDLNLKKLPGYRASYQTAPAGLSTQPVEPVGFGAEPYKESGDLTVKTLQKLEGKSTVSKQYISDLTNADDLKQNERDIMRNVLKEYPDGKDVPVKEFADKVKDQLLPLNRTTFAENRTAKYENINLPADERGPVENYSEHIYNSPIKTSAGDIHFSNATEGQGYFGHTRVEDLPTEGNYTNSRTGEKEGPVPSEPTRRVIEVQSDLYQKGNLENEKPAIAHSMSQAGIDEKTQQEVLDKPENAKKMQRIKDVKKLQQYTNPTAHFRMVREEVKQAAIDGKKTLLFPTGETAMKIEGLGQRPASFETWANGKNEKLTPEMLKVGMPINGNGGVWIVTELLGNGRFKVIPKGHLIDLSPEQALAKSSDYGKVGDKYYFRGRTETFDISGKINTSDPIYRFYEKDLGRYLKNTYDAKPFTDAKGVTWHKLEVKPEQAKQPVTAFKKGSGKVGFNRPVEEVKNAVYKAIKDAGIKNPEKAVDIVFTKDYIDKFASGSYEQAINPKLKSVITIMEKGGQASVHTGLHEAAHFMLDTKNGLISEADRKEMIDVARKNTGIFQKGLYKLNGYKGDDIFEEKIADEWAKQKSSEQGFKGPWKRALELFNNAISKIYDAFKKVRDTIDNALPKEGRQGGFAKNPFVEDKEETNARKGIVEGNPRETLKNAEKRAGVNSVERKPVLPQKKVEMTESKQTSRATVPPNETPAGTLEAHPVDLSDTHSTLIEQQKNLNEYNKIRQIEDTKDNPRTPHDVKIGELTQVKATLLESLLQNPYRTLSKYVNKKTGEFPEVLGKPITAQGKPVGEFGQRGDQIITEYGFKDTEEFRNGYASYLESKKRLESVSCELNQVRKQRADYIKEDKDARSLRALLNKTERISHEARVKQQHLKNIEKAQKAASMQLAKEEQARANYMARVKQVSQAKFTKSSWYQKMKEKIQPLKYIDGETKQIYRAWRTKIYVAKTIGDEQIQKYAAHDKADINTMIAYQAGAPIPWVREVFDSLYTEARRRGIDVTYRGEYLPQVYENGHNEILQALQKYMIAKGVEKSIAEQYTKGEEVPVELTNRLKLRPSFEKIKTFPDYKTAMEYGLKPKYKTIPQLIAYYRSDLEKTIANRELISDLMEKGKVLPINLAPDSWTNHNRGILSLPFLKGRNIAYYAEPKTAKMFNELFRDTENMGLGEHTLHFFAELSRRGQEIVLSAGVPSTPVHFFSIAQVIWHSTRGLGQMGKFDVLGGLKTIGYTNAAFFRSFLTKPSVNYLTKNSEYIRMMANNGIDLGQHVASFGKLYPQMIKKWGSLTKDVLKNPLQKSNVEKFKRVFGESFHKLFQEKAFASQLPMMHVAMFKQAYHDALSQGMDSATASGLAADMTRTAFGLMENVGRSPGTEDFISTAFFAPKFREGVLRTLGNTGQAGYYFARGLVKIPIGIVKGKGFKQSYAEGQADMKNPKYSVGRDALVGLFLMYGLYNALNYKMNGHAMWDNEPGKKFSLRFPTASGGAVYIDYMPSMMTIPRNIVGGAWDLATGKWSNAAQEFGSMFSMPIKTVTEILANSDYFGRQIYNPLDSAAQKSLRIAQYVGLQFNHPFIREIVNQIEGKNPLIQSITAAFAIPIKYASLAQLQKGAYYTAQQEQKQQSFNTKQEVKPIYDQIQQLKVAGELSKATDLFNKLTSEQRKEYKSINTSEKISRKTQSKIGKINPNE